LRKMHYKGYLKSPDYNVTIEEVPDDPYSFIMNIDISYEEI